MNHKKPRLVSVKDQNGDELWIAPAPTVREELEAERPDWEEPMATWNYAPAKRRASMRTSRSNPTPPGFASSPEAGARSTGYARIQFVPSNGFEGEQFTMNWCARCSLDKEINGTVLAEGREPTEADWCPIVANSFRGEAVEWREMPDGERLCTAFVPMQALMI